MQDSLPKRPCCSKHAPAPNDTQGIFRCSQLVPAPNDARGIFRCSKHTPVPNDAHGIFRCSQLVREALKQKWRTREANLNAT